MKKLPIIILLAIALTGCNSTDKSVDSGSSGNESGTSDSAPVSEKTDEAQTTAASSAETEEPTAEPIPEIRTVNLVCAGDNLIHSSIYNQAAARAAANGEEGYDFSPIYTQTADIIAAADLAVLNQETIITDEFPPSNYPMFCTPEEMGDEIVKLGFDAVSISNNHVLDKGEDGLKATLNYWETNYPDIALYGASVGEPHIPVLEVNGITFAFVGFMEHTNGLSLPEGSDCTITYLYETEEVERQVKRAAELADVVIASPHYGLEVSGEVTEQQLEMTQMLGDWGADIIIGTQPHTIQPMEFFKTARGTDAFVFYCLGNYVSGMENPLAMMGMLGTLTINKNPDGEIEITSPGAIPIISHYEYGYSNTRIYLWDNYTREIAATHGNPGFSYDLAASVIEDKMVIHDYLD